MGLAGQGEGDRSEADRPFRQLAGRRERQLRIQRGAAIAALFLQSTFGNLQQIIAAELACNGYPTFLAPAALAMGSVVTGENLFARSPVDAVRNDAGRPIYIVHTRADTRIDIGQSEQLAAAAQAAGANVDDLVPGERRACADAGGLPAGVRAAAGGILQAVSGTNSQ